jgi:hypothetical protein
MLVEPAAAGCDAGPGNGDAKIRRGDEPYLGAGIYSCTGEGQSVSRVTGPGQTRRFDFKIRNDSDVADDVWLYADVSGEESDFKVKFLKPNGKDITNNVFGDGKAFFAIAAGNSIPRIRIVVKGRSTVEIGDDIAVDTGGALGANHPDTIDTVIASAGLPT